VSRRSRNGNPGEEGQALLEFVISFPLVVFLVLAVLEFAHYANVVQLAQYAAFSAARAQIVHDRDEKAAASAAALAMVPFAEGDTTPYKTLDKDGTAASNADNVAKTLGDLTAKGKAYASGALFNQNNRVLNSFRWQTCTWMGYYDKNDQKTDKSYVYVKAGVCFTYPLRVQSLAVLSALIVRAKDRKADDDKVSSLFGGAATNAMTPPTNKDWWARAEKISSASGLVVVPVVQGCILGR
jgi:Flp pilus assembly protein TadG